MKLTEAHYGSRAPIVGLKLWWASRRSEARLRTRCYGETMEVKEMKKLILASLTVMAISLFFLPKVYSFQFGLGTKGFVKKVVEKGQSEGKIAKSEEEKKQNDENNGGGGGGGEEPGPLEISNVEIVSIQKWGTRNDERSVKVTWQTNKPATSKVNWRDQVFKDLGAGGWLKENQELVTNHEMEIYWIRPSTFNYFQIFSKAGEEEAQSEEYSLMALPIDPGEKGVFNVIVYYNSSNEEVVLYWYSLEDDSSGSYYYVSNNGTSWTFRSAVCSYNSFVQCYATHNSDSESAPKGSRRYYKISGGTIVFYIDFPSTDFNSVLYPQKP